MRSNFFGDKIFTPDDSDADIAAVVKDDCGQVPDLNEASADLYIEQDSTYGYGGTLYLIERDEPYEFDGFGSLDEAREWLSGLGVRSRNINETT